MLRATTFANALASASAAAYVVCRLMASVAPDTYATIAQSWFHGFAIAPRPWPSIDATGTAIGLVTFTVASWLFGYALASAYNRMAADHA